MDSRTTRAFWTLLILTPVIAELLSGSTLATMWIIPIVSFAQIAVYGLPVMIVRELRIRWKGGAIMQFALAGMMGAVNEGLGVGSWFNPKFKDLGWMRRFPHLLGVNWPWLIHLQIYHGIESTFAPIAIVELLYPDIANETWITRKRLTVLSIAFVVSFVAARLMGHFPINPLQTAWVFIVIAASVGAGWLLRRVRFGMARKPWPALRVAVFAFVAWFVYYISPRLAVQWGGGASAAIAAILFFGLFLVSMPLLIAYDRKDPRTVLSWMGGSSVFYFLGMLILLRIRGPWELGNVIVAGAFLAWMIWMLKQHGVPSDSSPLPSLGGAT